MQDNRRSKVRSWRTAIVTTVAHAPASLPRFLLIIVASLCTLHFHCLRFIATASGAEWVWLGRRRKSFSWREIQHFFLLISFLPGQTNNPSPGPARETETCFVSPQAPHLTLASQQPNSPPASLTHPLPPIVAGAVVPVGESCVAAASLIAVELQFAPKEQSISVKSL